MRSKSQSGVALVITLIMLSVITFMAVTFLVISRHEGAQVATLSSQSNAKFAADAALEQAKAQIIAQMLANNNGLSGTLLVSTNYLTTNFLTGPPASFTNILNVSYLATNSGIASYEQMLNNLLILPRAPVFLTTNKSFPNNIDFRYYLDLNRNGRYDTNGLVGDVDANNTPIVVGGVQVSNTRVGDPEWVGVLNRPDFRHSSSNYFVARYAFIALPIGNSLDLNYIHNQAKQLLIPNNGFQRDQGVGSWEINLAGFLHDINTNWDFNGISYNYAATNLSVQSSGTSFNDASFMLRYRYSLDYTRLRSAFNLFGTKATNFLSDGINDYSYGQMGMAYQYTNDPDTASLLNSPWPGDDSISQYFSTQDLFNKVPGSLNSFSNRLYQAGFASDSYNRYTFYRLLAQMSFGSAPEPSPYPYTSKLNLNYCNVGGYTATNFQPWQPIQFFTNAADRMLKATFPPIITVYSNGLGRFTTTNYLSINNIPVYPVNLYTPSVHRLLQLAANIYDASTNKTGNPNNPVNFDYPSVFRPIFTNAIFNGMRHVSIIGYTEVTNNVITDASIMSAPLDLRRLTDLSTIPLGKRFTNNIYGVPYVIGAKQGLPSFNKFTSMPAVQIQRKIQIVKPKVPSTTTAGWTTNYQYILGISNAMAVDCWFPYKSNLYNRQVDFYVTNDLTIVITNNIGIGVTPIMTNIGNSTLSVPTGPSYWPGTTNKSVTDTTVKNIFKTPFIAGVIALPDSIIRYNPIGTNQIDPFRSTVAFDYYGTNIFAPRWGFNVTNRLRMIMLDHASGRIIDYVQLGALGAMPGMEYTNDISVDLMAQTTNYARYWDTNAINSGNRNFLPVGIFNQIDEGTKLSDLTNAIWNSVILPNGQGSARIAVSNFVNFFTQTNLVMQMQDPFEPIFLYYRPYVWSVNDPLVHYTTSDLINQSKPIPDVATFTPNVQTNFQILTNALHLITTNRYQPWGAFSTLNALAGTITSQISYKDPLVSAPDLWSFPTNKYPNIGWLGRVHRGTPWQSVFLKSATVNPLTWNYWTGNITTNYYQSYGVYSNNIFVAYDDTAYSQPTNDWILMDLFTTAPNDNASRGQLSVNQTNFAAWSAILDGVSVIGAQTPNGPLTNITINPDSVSSSNYVYSILTNLFTVRTNFPGTNVFINGQYATNIDSQGFTSVGQILAAPLLTVQSPFLNTTNVVPDYVYERIPQQILSLLRLGSPRYVIFSYGQALKPADHSIVPNGQYFGLCTNYQIAGEVVTRTVLRIENYPIPGHAATNSPHVVVESFSVVPPE